MHKEADESKSKDESYYNEENIVVQQIIENKAIAVYNNAVDDNSIARYWKISNNHNNTIIEDYIRTN